MELPKMKDSPSSTDDTVSHTLFTFTCTQARHACRLEARNCWRLQVPLSPGITSGAQAAGHKRNDAWCTQFLGTAHPEDEKVEKHEAQVHSKAYEYFQAANDSFGVLQGRCQVFALLVHLDHCVSRVVQRHLRS
jgi:hypothetical protein